MADGRRGELSLQPGVVRKRRCLSAAFGDPLGVDSTCSHPPSMPWSVADSGVYNHVIENFLSQIEIQIASSFLTFDLDRETDERKAVVVTQACGSQMLLLGKSRPEIAR